jgi:hypothetical protein
MCCVLYFYYCAYARDVIECACVFIVCVCVCMHVCVCECMCKCVCVCVCVSSALLLMSHHLSPVKLTIVHFIYFPFSTSFLLHPLPFLSFFVPLFPFSSLLFSSSTILLFCHLLLPSSMPSPFISTFIPLH